MFSVQTAVCLDGTATDYIARYNASKGETSSTLFTYRRFQPIGLRDFYVIIKFKNVYNVRGLK